MCKHAPIGIAFGRVRPFLILRVRVLGMRVLGMVRSGHQLANLFPSLRSQARALRGGAVLHSTFSVRSWQGGGAFKHHGGGRTWVLGNASSLSFATGNMCDPAYPEPICVTATCLSSILGTCSTAHSEGLLKSVLMKSQIRWRHPVAVTACLTCFSSKLQ